VREKIRSVLPEIGVAAHQRMGVQVLVFRISSEAKPLLDSSGQWKSVVIANCPAICGDLVGFDACGASNSTDRFTGAAPLPTDFLRQPPNLRVRLDDLLTVLQFPGRNLGL